MSVHYVRTIDIGPMLTSTESDLIQNLPIDETIINRFPFDDRERNKIEVFKKGTQIECQEYINEMDERIRNLFKIDCCCNELC